MTIGGIPADEREARARRFMEWFAVNSDRVRRCIPWTEYDEDLFMDAFVKASGFIRRTGTAIRAYDAYFLRVYRNVRSDFFRKRMPNTEDPERGYVRYAVSANDRDVAEYEVSNDSLVAEILDYVRDNYDEAAVSLFEIYVGLFPDISYSRMADMLGMSKNKIWPVIGKIKKDVVKKFGGRKDFILSQVDF